MITCIAIDDEPLALELIKKFCAQIPFLELQKTFTNPKEAEKHLRKFPVDLLFLDIQMPDISGIDFYKAVPQEKTAVIFTTAHSEFAVEGFNLNAIDYLLKPYEFKRFEQAVNKANEQLNASINKINDDNAFLFVRADYSLVKIVIAEIEYIEGLDDYIKIYTAGKRPILTLMSLKAVLEKLPASEFVRVHRSFIVPIKKIVSVRNKKIQLTTIEVPIGNRFEDEVQKVLGKK